MLPFEDDVGAVQTKQQGKHPRDIQVYAYTHRHSSTICHCNGADPVKSIAAHAARKCF